MKVWHRWTVCMAAILLALMPAVDALAASISGRSSTEIEWYDDADGDTAMPAYQYLMLNVRDIDGDGLDFRGYGRLADDFKNEVDIESRLYYAYFEKKDLIDDLNLKFGRQFISTTAGASMMDGLYLDYDNLGPLKLALFGGGDVAYYSGYSADDLMFGGELSGRFFDSLDLGLSYVQKWDNGDLAKELFGLDVDYDFNNVLNLYSEVQFDYLSNSISYFLGGAKYRPNDKWGLRAEYLYSLPVFSATSIYSVFAVNEYEEVMAELTYRIAVGLHTFGRYTREIYPEFADADVFEAGIEKIRTRNFSGYLTGVVREDGDGQDLMGFKARAAYLFNSYVQAGVGLEVDVLDRRIDDEDDETTSSRYWADVTGYITKKVNVQAKIERVESDLWDYYNRGRIRLNILF